LFAAVHESPWRQAAVVTADAHSPYSVRFAKIHWTFGSTWYHLVAGSTASDGSLPMTDANNTAIDAIQIDEDILAYTVSDEALEAAAGERGPTAWSANFGTIGCC
jgi:hypothetical protein